VSRFAFLFVCIGAALSLGVMATFAGSAASFALATYKTGKGPISVAVGDLNGDGKPDLATANYGEGANSVSVVLNRGNGSFRARRDYPVREGPGSVAIADLNGDRRADLAVASEVSNTVGVLLGRSDGSLQRRRDYATGRAPFSVAIGDLNGDRKLDLVTANVVPHTVSVLLNSGGGGFQTKVDYRTGRRPQEVVIGDLNGDRKPDLATGNRSDTVTVLANRGNGTFEAGDDYRAGSGPRAIAIGDLNGDSRLDLVTANTNVGVYTVSVLINGGTGSFRGKRDYAVDEAPGSVAIGDLNGDGKVDLATANEVGASVSVLFNKGGGVFGARRDYDTRHEPYSLAIGDLNGDRKFDLATSNEPNTVSVLLNSTGLCTVPKVRGKTLSAAKRAIARARCRVGNIRRAYSSVVREGRVISQQPNAGTVLPSGGRVRLVVSRGRGP
jgi:hypothetical protein